MRSPPNRSAVPRIDRRQALLFLALATGGLPGQLRAQEPPVLSPELPARIPIFPLPDVTLFPSTTAPFHIFEARYRAMVADALAGNSIIGMVVLKPGYEVQYEGRPPVHAIGCAGVIASSRLLADGRYDIILRGLTRFRILGEDQSRAYRLADVAALPDRIDDTERARLSELRRQVEDAVRTRFPSVPELRADLADEAVIDGLSLLLPIRPEEKLELLEAEDPVERAETLIRFLRGGVQASL